VQTHVWRLVKSKYASSAFDGEGARLFGGRWNRVGTRVAYAASNSALAVLEVLVHLDGTTALSAYSLVEAALPESAIEDVEMASLQLGWNGSPVPPHAQALGDEWVRAGRSLALRLPSAIVQGGGNILLNPMHRDFGRLEVVSAEPFAFDPRLLRERGALDAPA
jgi:RES domain-containing protein